MLLKYTAENLFVKETMISGGDILFFRRGESYEIDVQGEDANFKRLSNSEICTLKVTQGNGFDNWVRNSFEVPDGAEINYENESKQEEELTTDILSNEEVTYLFNSIMDFHKSNYEKSLEFNKQRYIDEYLKNRDFEALKALLEK